MPSSCLFATFLLSLLKYCAVVCNSVNEEALVSDSTRVVVSDDVGSVVCNLVNEEVVSDSKRVVVSDDVGIVVCDSVNEEALVYD